jgi:hypothetical protein
MPIVVHAIDEAVRRIGGQRYDQRDGRDKRDQTIAAKTRAQDEGAIWRRTDKPSLRVVGGQPERSEGNPEKRQRRNAGQPERSEGNPEKRQRATRGNAGQPVRK